MTTRVARDGPGAAFGRAEAAAEAVAPADGLRAVVVDAVPVACHVHGMHMGSSAARKPPVQSSPPRYPHGMRRECSKYHARQTKLYHKLVSHDVLYLHLTDERGGPLTRDHC